MRSVASSRLAPAWLYLIFFLSGLCGLIYESIWSRYLKLFVGSAATAQVLVLALFMGGMSVGAWLAGRWVRRIVRPVLVYGAIEGAVGLYAMIFPWLHAGVTRLAYDVIFPALGQGAGVTGAKWFLAAGLILPPCVALGMTFPLMSVGILRRRPEDSGRVLGVLYFSNSLGASVGALVSGFALVPAVGLPGALAVAGVLNLIIMAAAGLERAPTIPLDTVTPGTEDDDAGGRGGGLDRRVAVMLMLVAVGTGLSSFMYEIAWIRLLSMVIGSATHSFEVMLSAFVLGLALGAGWVRGRLDRFRRPALALGVVQLVMGFCAVLTIPAYELAVLGLGALLDSPLGLRTDGGWLAFNVVRYIVCLLIMLPATFCAGMTLPLVTLVALRRGATEAVVGRVYAVNTLGAISGAVLAGIALLPAVGLRMTLVLAAAVDMALGLWVLRRERGALSPGVARRATRLAWLTAVSALGFGGLVYEVDPGILASTVFRNGRTRLSSDVEVLFYEDGRTASVILTEDASDDRRRVVYTNGKPDATVVLDRYPDDRPAVRGPRVGGDEPNQFLVGLLPHMARPEARRAALIGFGSGVSAHVLLGSPHLERLDTIEIEGEMIEASRLFLPENERAHADPRSHLIIDDAKAFFASSGARYDFIVSEPTNPWVSGVSSLFTVEFYREVKRYLVEDGVLCQWIQGYELGDDLMLSVLAAIDDEFDAYLIVQVGALDWLIMASPGDAPISLSDAPLRWDGMSRTLDLIGVRDRGDIDVLISANRAMIHDFVGPRRPNMDARPILDTGAERARFMKLYASFLEELRGSPPAVYRWIGGIERASYRSRSGARDALRDPAIFEAPEQAARVLEAFERPEAPLPSGVDVDPMKVWLTAEQGRAQGFGSWDAWLRATYDVYQATTPYVDVTASAWWRRVLAIRLSGRGEAPVSVLRAVDLMDALAREDGAALGALVTAEREDPAGRLPDPFVAVTGLLALRMRGEDARALAAYAREHMNLPAPSDLGARYAYESLRAWALAQE